jgi:hypothetical protein
MSEISQATFYDAATFFWNGKGSEETYEPFCEVRLIEPYPHKSVEALKLQLKSPDRIQAMKQNASITAWIVDKVLEVTGLNSDIIASNQAIWSKRRWVSIGGAVAGGLVFGLGVLIGLKASAVKGVLFAVAGSQIVLGAAIITGGIGLAILAGGIRRALHAHSELGKSRLSSCAEIATKRQELLKGSLYWAIQAKGAPGMTLSKDHVIAPQECEWLWIQNVRAYTHAHSPRFIDQEGKQNLMLEFARYCPFAYTTRALMTASEADAKQVLIEYLEPVLPAAKSLATQLASITDVYDRYEDTILKNAQKNIQLVEKSRAASLAFIESIFSRQCTSARTLRDAALTSLRPDTSEYTEEQKRAFEARFERQADVKEIRATYASSISNYKNYRTLARIAANAWFDRQVNQEVAKKERDLSANKRDRLAYLELFTPSTQAILDWTVKAIDYFEKDKENNSLYPNHLIDLDSAPEMPFIAPPQAPTLSTAEAPSQPSESDISSWWPTAGQSLTLLAAAGGIATLWNQFSREQESQPSQNTAGAAQETLNEAEENSQQPPSYEDATRQAG